MMHGSYSWRALLQEEARLAAAYATGRLKNGAQTASDRACTRCLTMIPNAMCSAAAHAI